MLIGAEWRLLGPPELAVGCLLRQPSSLLPALRCIALVPALPLPNRLPGSLTAAPPAGPRSRGQHLQSTTFSESSAPGRDYLAEVCREWEAAAEVS